MVGRAADAVGDPARAARAAVDDEVRAAARRRPLLQTNGTFVGTWTNRSPEPLGEKVIELFSLPHCIPAFSLF